MLALDLTGWLAACADIADARITTLDGVKHPVHGPAPKWQPGRVPRAVRRSWDPVEVTPFVRGHNVEVVTMGGMLTAVLIDGWDS